MPARPAPALGLHDGDRERLTGWARSSSLRAGLAQRARIVLLAADGVSNTEIANRVGVSRPTVIDWRTRYERSGMTGLDDEPRGSPGPGRPRRDHHCDPVAAGKTPGSVAINTGGCTMPCGRGLIQGGAR